MGDALTRENEINKKKSRKYEFKDLDQEQTYLLFPEPGSLISDSTADKWMRS